MALHEHEIQAAAMAIGVETAVLKAILKVEARGEGFKDGMLVILYEPHIMHRLLTEAGLTRELEILERRGLAYRRWGEKPYPRSIEDRWEQVKKASTVAGEEYALSSASLGLPQIMGFNHKQAGYDSALHMANAFILGGEPEQLGALATFIENDPRLLRAARDKDWTAFARTYNGPGYRRNRYHINLATYYNMYSAKLYKMMRLGSRGEMVRKLQSDLNLTGYYFNRLDGIFGVSTQLSVEKFQKDHDLIADGIAGPKTLRKLQDVIRNRISGSIE